jgi:hypothetical protein
MKRKWSLLVDGNEKEVSLLVDGNEKEVSLLVDGNEKSLLQGEWMRSGQVVI